MPTNVQIPGLGESVSEATIVKWHKSDGQSVAQDEPICELETEKANVDLPSPAAGVIRRIKPEGAKVKIGDTIATIESNGKVSVPAPKSSAPAGAKESVELSPAVRRLMEENMLNASDVRGTGSGGRITKEDVLKHLEARKSKSIPAPREQPEPAEAIVAMTPTISGADGPVRRVELTKIRRKIAERLVSAQHTAAILTTFNEVDLTNVIDLRSRHKESFEKRYGAGLGFMSFFVKATTLALREFERVNASIEGDEIVFHDYVHMGIAVSTDRGLAVPVLRNVHTMSFAKIETEIKRLAAATREGKLGLNELSGGTFTITNGGVFGSLLSTPILNPPQSGILGMHKIQDRPVAMNGQVVVRPMMYVALSYDHRLIDGRESVSFLVRVKEMLEDPARLMLEV
ncbi:MAG: 2-oxoglutarate dehydrogenase complex dihydrolipoyllysine-residue succinyltransferase [Tepidisphaeraceae bacterium]